MSLHILLILIIPALLIIKYAVKLYWTQRFNYWRKRNVKGPTPQLYSGTFPKSKALLMNFIEELHEIYLKYKKSQRFIGIYVGPNPKLFILDPELAVQIVTTHFKSFRDNVSSLWTNLSVEQMRPQSPFVSTGDHWKNNRSELLPAITANKLKAAHPNYQLASEHLVDFIKLNNKQQIDGFEISQRFAMDCMIKFIWGLDESGFGEELSYIHKMANAMMDNAVSCVHYYNQTLAVPWLRKLFPKRFFPKHTDEFFTQLTKDAINVRKANANLNRGDFVDHLIQLQEKKALTDTQLSGHCTSMVVDGYATTALFMAQTLLLIARNPRVQEKLREELLQVGELTFENVNELKYLDQCLQESLRILPPLPTLFKICTEEITLTNSNGMSVTLQPNDHVYISAFSFHRDPDTFENPEEYWPERFDEHLGGVKKFEDMGMFLPFGDGPRKCPGMKLALYEAKMGVAAILKHYEISITGETRTDNKIAPMPYIFSIDGEIKLIFKDLKQ